VIISILSKLVIILNFHYQTYMEQTGFHWEENFEPLDIQYIPVFWITAPRKPTKLSRYIHYTHNFTKTHHWQVEEYTISLSHTHWKGGYQTHSELYFIKKTPLHTTYTNQSLHTKQTTKKYSSFIRCRVKICCIQDINTAFTCYGSIKLLPIYVFFRWIACFTYLNINALGCIDNLT